MKLYDVVIIGGGLAGLTAALHLNKIGYQVLAVEKQLYPHHKVCGEYVSNEIVPYLDSLGVTLTASDAVAINRLQLSAVSGKVLEVDLPLGGVGISRFHFDNLLYQKAITAGIAILFDSVNTVRYIDDGFLISTVKEQVYNAKVVIGAYGKRSLLDKQLQRNFIQQKSSWLGVKAHYKIANFPDNLVALHNFRGGYGGLSKTETGVVNFCYLVSYDSFQKEKNISDFNAKVVAKNPYLSDFLAKAEPVFEKPLSIAQISFHAKSAVEDHVLMCGDTAGLIHPLCGNGMAMAIHSAKIASECIHRFFTQDTYSRKDLERNYQQEWTSAFQYRLRMGRRLQNFLLNEKVSNAAMGLITKSPWLLQQLIKKTHGKPIVC